MLLNHLLVKDLRGHRNGCFNMKITLSPQYSDFQESQKMALLFEPISTFWLYFPQKNNRRFFFYQLFRVLKWNYEATSLISIFQKT